MSEGQVFASALELNTEKGKISQPYVPMVRFSTPLMGGNQVRYGVVVVNIFADYFFKYISDANRNQQGQVFYLLASNGDYLFHPEIEKRFGSQLGHHANFAQDFPDVLPQLKKHKNGIFPDANQIITYQAIYPSVDNPENYWLLVGVVPKAFALAKLKSFEYVFFLLVLVVIFLVFVITRYFLRNLLMPLEFVTCQLQSLGRGEVTVKTLAYAGQDELRKMLDCSQTLLANMENLAKQADAVAKGDFSGQVQVLSKQDRLGTAINNMTSMLRAAKQEEQNRNWLRDGLEQLSKALTGDLTSAQLAEISISILARHLDAGRGVFYCYNSAAQTLELLGSYMYSERNQLGSCFKLGEGAIGQVARERKPILLSGFQQEQAAIVTGTSSNPPLYTFTYPLLHEADLLGVIELASFEHFNALQQTFLQEATNTIASFLYVVEQQERIKTLLLISEAAEKEARDKSICLQQANAQMEEQQHLLQQQAEELQQSNAQMEETQQQLQQQTKELQQTNAQMEEQQQQLQQQTEELQQTNAQMEEAQQQLEQQNLRLVESQQELDARAKQLALSSQYKSEFLANMSHELRTPLNSIILLSKMLASNTDKNLSADEVRHAEIIHSAGQELLRLISDVLDLSKIEAGRMELHLSKVSSQDLLTEQNELFEHSAKEKNLAFVLQDDLQAEFVSDKDRLSQILRNLLSNAFKFTKSGSVTLSIKRVAEPKWPIRISVKDTGMGIEEQKRKVIFEAFQQADGSISRQYGGTGLGLSISLRFAQLLGGSIELNSIVGEGSEFLLLLPDSLAEKTTDSDLHNLNSPPATAQAAGESKKLEAQLTDKVSDDREQLKPNDAVILLIDDDPLFAQALIDINHKLGYKTLLAMSGTEGLALAKNYQPNGILLDLGLPDMDGSSVLHEIKSQPELADIPVYVVSGREKDAALMQKGLLGYLQKPVNAQQIGKAEAELLAFICETVAKQTILVVENGGITAEQIRALITPQLGSVLKATNDMDMAALLANRSCCLAIIDLEGQDAKQALMVAQTLRKIDANLRIIFVGEQALSDDDEAQMHQYSDSIIIKAPQSEQRLLKNIERFLTSASHNPESFVSAAQAKEHNSSHKRLAGRQILVVDDDARNLFVITAALEKEGAKVDGALNGKSALEFLQTHRVDLIFMDVMMPEMDGYQTIVALRSKPALAKIPVVVLTAKSLSADREQALAAGADDYLAKPADFDVLINMAVVWCANKH